MKRIFSILVLLLLIFETSALARPGLGGRGGGGQFKTPPPIVVAPRPIIRENWTLDELSTRLISIMGVKITNKSEDSVDFEFYKFSGYLQVFNSKEELSETHSLVFKENIEGTNYTWSYSVDNILLVLEGHMERKYVELFEDFILSLSGGNR